MHIGSSGSNFLNWINIAESSKLIMVDADNKNSSNLKYFRNVKIINSLISYKSGISSFFSTKDPECSSLLEPNSLEYNNWYGRHRFKVEKKNKVKVSSINLFLKKNKINYIDWLVIDVQGIDLKIVKSLNKNLRNKISIVDIEPGLHGIYKGEDNISNVFDFMTKEFEFSDIRFGYNYKIKNEKLTTFEKKILFRFNSPSKFYSNITFINKNKKNFRINQIKVIYLILNNKFFEARNYIKNYLINDRFYEDINNKINIKIFYQKIIYLFLSPIFILKKFFNNFYNFFSKI